MSEIKRYSVESLEHDQDWAEVVLASDHDAEVAQLKAELAVYEKYEFQQCGLCGARIPFREPHKCNQSLAYDALKQEAARMRAALLGVLGYYDSRGGSLNSEEAEVRGAARAALSAAHGTEGKT